MKLTKNLVDSNIEYHRAIKFYSALTLSTDLESKFQVRFLLLLVDITPTKLTQVNVLILLITTKFNITGITYYFYNRLSRSAAYFTWPKLLREKILSIEYTKVPFQIKQCCTLHT